METQINSKLNSFGSMHLIKMKQINVESEPQSKDGDQHTLGALGILSKNRLFYTTNFIVGLQQSQ